MPAEPLFDYSNVDFDRPMADIEAVKKINPHRGEMIQINGVAHWTDDFAQGVGWRDVRDDEFWVPGHIPGRPLLPGVLMIESAAQLSSFIHIKGAPPEATGFLGFTRCDECAFRGQVVPGDRLVLLAQSVTRNRRRFISKCQGFVNENLVFEVTVTGMQV